MISATSYSNAHVFAHIISRVDQYRRSRWTKTNTNKDYKFIPYEKPPRPIKPIKPIYPKSAIKLNIEGEVIVQCFINKNGIVENAVVIQGYPNTGLNESALDAVKKTKFMPAQQNNRRVGVLFTIPIKYNL